MCSWHAFRRRPLCHSVLVAEGYKDRARSWGTLGEASSDATRSTASSEANLELNAPAADFSSIFEEKTCRRVMTMGANMAARRLLSMAAFSRLYKAA